MISSGAGTSAKSSRQWLWLMSLAAIVMTVMITMPLASRLDPVIGDFLLLHHQNLDTDPSEEVVVVAITEETLAQFPYRSPIDRQFLAELVQTIDSRSPKSIGLDILLDSPSELTKDRQLLDTIDMAEAPVILANTMLGNGLTPSQLAYLKDVTKDRLSGSIVLQRDKIDGVVRHIPIISDGVGNRIPTFASMLARPEVFNAPGPGRLLHQPSSPGGVGPFPKYPAHTVALLPSEWLAGKIVLIGTDLPSTDRHLAPIAAPNRSIDGTLSGIEVHAHILSQILQERSLPTISQWGHFAIVTLATIVSAM